MFIQTEQTPNPATLKFLPGRTVLDGAPVDFTSAEAAERSPLAARLFQLDGVQGVFLGGDFITVTKRPDKEWYVMKPAILGIIMEHFVSGAPTLLDEDEGDAAGEDDTLFEPEDAEIVAQIRELLDTRVRPAVAQDGGDIIFRGFQRGVVYLHMRGSCAGCPSSVATLKMGIENMLRHYVPEVVEVRAAQ